MSKIKKGDSIIVTVDNKFNDRYRMGDKYNVAIACNDGSVYIDMNGEEPLWLTENEFEKLKDFQQ